MPQLSDDMQITRDAIGAIVQQSGWKLVYAANEAEFEAIWDKMTSDALALGVEEIQNWALEQIDAAFEQAAKYE